MNLRNWWYGWSVRRCTSSSRHRRPKLELLESRLALTMGLGTPISDNGSYPYRAATKVWAYWEDTDSWFQGSGTLIDSYHVLTAAHVIYDSDPDSPETGFADDVVVLPGYSGYNGADLDDMVAFGLATDSRLTVDSYYTTHDLAAYDMGLITLDRPIGDSTGSLGWEENDEDFFDGQPTLNIYHYPAETGSDSGRTLYRGSGTASSAGAELFYYNFQNFSLTEQGSSGGGIYRYDSATDIRYVVGVVSRGNANDTGDVNPYIDNYWAPQLTDWLDDDPKPASKPDLVDYDWFFDSFTEKPEVDEHVWMRSSAPLHSSVSSTSPHSGDLFSATARVYNTGTEDAPGVKVSFYLSVDTVIDSSVDTLLGSRFVDVDESDWSDVTWTGNLPGGVTGTHHIGWKIDPDNSVSEYGYGSSEANVGLHPTSVLIKPKAHHLAFTQQPASAKAGQAISPAVTVRVVNVNGVLVSDSTANVTLSLNAGNGASLLGSVTATAVNGVATFNDIKVIKAGTGYSLTASTSNLTGVSSNSFSISPAAAHHLFFSTQPTSAVAGAKLSPVTLQVVDAFNNYIAAEAFNRSVTLTLTSPQGATLSGTTFKSTVNATVTFDDLVLTRAGTYTLTATDVNLGSRVSSAFSIGHAGLDHLAFIKQPTTTVAGATMSSVTVRTEDRYGNAYLPSSNVTVYLGAARGAGIFGTKSLNTSGGSATFTDLSVKVANTGYSLKAISGSLPVATSGSFNIVAAQAAGLAFARQPGNSLAGQKIAGPPVVRIIDVYGNLVTSGSHNVSITLGNARGAQLSGTKTVASSAGLATFGNLTVFAPNVNYTLLAANELFKSVTSTAFAVVNHAPVLNNALDPKLTLIVEDTKLPSGTLIRDFAAAGISDADANASKGIAVTFAGNTNGKWEYSLNNGTAWVALGTPSATAALLLPADAVTKLRFIPNLNFSGTASISYVAWDRTRGLPGSTLTLTGNQGGAKSLSTAVEKATQIVSPVNDPPSLNVGSAISYVHNSSAKVLAASAILSDVDSQNFAGGHLKLHIETGKGASNQIALGSGFSVDASRNVKQGATIIGTLNVAGGQGTTDLVITFKAAASVDVVRALVKSLTFKTVGGAAGTRSVQFLLSDHAGGAETLSTKTVNVT